MRPILLDSDAFIFVRKLGLLVMLEEVAKRTSVVLTEYIARQELAPLQSEIELLCRRAVLTIAAVSKGTPEFVKYRELTDPAKKRQLRAPYPIDKGECEAVAWACTRVDAERPVFVTCDRGAHWLAQHERVSVTDVLGLGIGAVVVGAITRKVLQDALSVWDSPAQQIGKPPGYSDFQAAFIERSRGMADLGFSMPASGD